MTGKINHIEVNYAKQTQFQKCSNVHNFSNSNDYEQKTTNYELLKTKPIQTQFKPKQSQFQKQYYEW